MVIIIDLRDFVNLSGMILIYRANLCKASMSSRLIPRYPNTELKFLQQYNIEQNKKIIYRYKFFSSIDLRKHKKAATTNLPYCHIDPRTPCRVRLLGIDNANQDKKISIHALM